MHKVIPVGAIKPNLKTLSGWKMRPRQVNPERNVTVVALTCGKFERIATTAV
jgi:hypothetical protein